MSCPDVKDQGLRKTFDKEGASDDDDSALIRRMADGDTSALEALYARYGGRIFNYVCSQVSERELAEEVLQDVMLAAWRSASRFRGDSRALTWLLAIAHNRAITARQRRTVPQTFLEDAANGVDPPLIDTLTRQTEALYMQTALARLPAEQRETLELIFYHELSGLETAAVLGVAPGTVKSRVHRAIGRLRRLLKEELLDE